MSKSKPAKKMGFGKAFETLKTGAPIRRRSWTNKRRHVANFDGPLKISRHAADGSVDYEDWRPTPGELFAENWTTVKING